MLLNMNEIDIKKIRKDLGLTQVEMAKKLGVDTKTVQNWEYGSNIPKSKHAILRELALNQQKYAGGAEQSNVNGDNINGNNVTVNKPDMEKLLDLLASKEQSLVKAQEQIDKLLGIIERLTK